MMKKRIASLTLALCLALSLTPAALAEEDPFADFWIKEAIDVGPADVYYPLAERSKKIRMYPMEAEGGGCGYVDEQVRWVIPPIYKHAEPFLDCGYGVATGQDGKRYIINTDGDLLTTIGSYTLYDVQGGNAIIGEHNVTGVISLTGKTIAPILPGSSCAFELGGKYITQNYLTNPGADRIRPQMWIFDATGRDLFPNIYCCDIQVLSDDRMSVSVDGQMNAYGFVEMRLADFNGKFYPLPAGYEKRFAVVRDFVGDYAQVFYHGTKNGGGFTRYYFFIDKQGKMVAPDREAYDTTDILPATGCFYAAITSGRWRKYSPKGKDLGAAPGEMDATCANGTVMYGHWLKGVPNFTLFTLDGKQIPTPPDYVWADNMVTGDDSGNIYYQDGHNAKHGLMDPTGKVIIPMQPGYIYRMGDYYRQSSPDLDAPVCIYDLKGNLITSVTYAQTRGHLMVSGGRTIYSPPSQVPKNVMAPISNVRTVTAAPSSTKLLVNGKAAAADAYLIEQNNYMKLRDLAALLNGSPKQFEITYDGAKGAINVITGKPYTPAGGELTPGSGGAKSATTGTSRLYIDGKAVHLKSYAIGGNNFYKLRDVMRTLGVKVGWDSATSGVSLDTAQSYAPDGPAPGVCSIHSGLEPTKYVDISEGSRKDGAQVITWEKTEDLNQKFVLEKVGSKYRIVALHSGKALSVDGTPNSQLIQKTISNDPNQLFTLIPQPSGGYNIVAATGQYLGVAAGSTNNGAAIIVWDKTGSKGQEFFFE